MSPVLRALRTGLYSLHRLVGREDRYGCIAASPTPLDFRRRLRVLQALDRALEGRDGGRGRLRGVAAGGVAVPRDPQGSVRAGGPARTARRASPAGRGGGL